MRRLLAVCVVLALGALAAPAPAADVVPQLAEDARLFAGGGTNLTNGLFFPGTATCNSDGCEMLGGQEPLQVAKGSNIEFTNLDPAVVTNGHRIVSLETKKKKKRRVPLFFSDQVDGPDSTIVKTSKVKPGIYFYMCTTHFGMYGAIEVTEGM